MSMREASVTMVDGVDMQTGYVLPPESEPSMTVERYAELGAIGLRCFGTTLVVWAHETGAPTVGLVILTAFVWLCALWVERGCPAPTYGVPERHP